MFATAQQADSAAFQNSALFVENKEKKAEGYYVEQCFWCSLHSTYSMLLYTELSYCSKAYLGLGETEDIAKLIMTTFANSSTCS